MASPAPANDPKESPNYFERGLNLNDSLGKAITLLEQQDDGSADIAETIGTLKREKFRVKTDLQLILEGKLKFNPPTPTQIATIQKSSAHLDAMIKNSILANDLSTLATAAITAWRAPQI